MDIKTNIELGNLINCYGQMLTQKQFDIIEDYCFKDLSLTEIAENYNITKQAVSDILNRTINILNNYESKLHFLNKTKKISSIINNSTKENAFLNLKKISLILEE